jgi:3-phenylpropionate/trans-cinnamate dioxygenase ferredoxin subunit
LAEWVRVAERNDIAPGTAKRIEVRTLAVALFNLDGEFYAIGDTCPRDDGSLSQGVLFGEMVQCPVQACKYELTSGACATFPDFAVPRYEVRVDGSAIHIRLD